MYTPFKAISCNAVCFLYYNKAMKYLSIANRSDIIMRRKDHDKIYFCANLNAQITVRLNRNDNRPAASRLDPVVSRKAGRHGYSAAVRRNLSAE